MPDPTTSTVDASTDNDTTPPVLDSASFPHIMEMILSYASYRTLLVMRTMNKALKKRVDTLLMHHVLLQPWDRDDHRQLTFAEVGDVFLTKQELRRLPALKNGIYDLPIPRVVDVNGSTPTHLIHAWSGRSRRDETVLVGALWLRTRGTTWVDLYENVFDTLVHIQFLQDASARPRRRHEDDDRMISDVPLSASKVVINIEHDCAGLIGNPGEDMYLLHPEAPDLEKLVFLSKPPPVGSTSRRKPCVAGDHSHPKLQRSLADFIGSVASQYWRGASCRIVLVGFALECITPELFAESDLVPPSKQDVCTAFIQMIYEIYLASRPDEILVTKAQVKQLLKQTEILDHETYRRRVGEEAYQLETVWEGCD